MKISDEMDMDTGQWATSREIHWFRIETDKGVFTISERDGFLDINSSDGQLRIRPRAANSVQIEAVRR